MKRAFLLCIPLSFFAACGPAAKASCKDTGCSAGSACNTTTGACELITPQGGGGGSLGGGLGGGTAAGGGGGGGDVDAGLDAGVDAGVVIDPFDDGGVFVPGDICANALVVEFDGGTSAMLSVDLATATDQYAASCNDVGNGNDLIFAVTLTQPGGLIVTATDTGGGNQDAVLALIASPCPTFMQRTCVDTTADPEVMTLANLAAGTWYVLLENYGDTPIDGTYDIRFEVVPPVIGAPNDTCATPATLVPNVTTTVNANASNADYSFTCSSPRGADVVYQFTTTAPQKITLLATGTGNADAVLSLRNAPCDDSSNELHCADDGADGDPEIITVFNAPAGTYYVVLAAWSASVSAGTFGLQLTLEPPVPPPANDTCAAPTTLVPNMTQVADLSAAVRDYQYSCAFPAGGDVVFTFTTTQAQRVVVTAAGVGFEDGVLSLREAPCATSVDLTCANNGGIGEAETLVRNNLPAGTYYVLLASNGLSALFGVQLTLEPPRLPPTNESCTAPEVVTLTGGAATRFIDLSTATADIASDLCTTNADGADVVYEVTIPTAETLTVVVTPVGTVLDLLVFARAPVCAMASEVCSDMGVEGDAETLLVANTTGGPRTVFVVVKAYDALYPGEANISFTSAP